jgi:pimeloyl-ACP methyl ester carboxylesterase
VTSRLARALSAIAAGLVALLLAGATYQGVATALERHRFPHPGRQVPAGSHQLHIYCTGTGGPVVVLEAPATGMSAAWGWVQPLVAQRTRVCSYDRAGLGWSEAGDGIFDPARAPEELRTLLRNANEPAPYVIAGQGFGAALARLFAARYHDEVAALVLIDPPAPESGTRTVQSMTRMAALSPWLARTGVLRVTGTASAEVAGLNDPSAGALRTFLLRPDHLTRAGRELARWDDTVRLAAAATVPDDLPTATVHIGSGGRAAMLTNEADARRAAAAILAALPPPVAP